MRTLNCMEDFKRDIAYQVLVREDDSILLSGGLKDKFHDIKVEIVVELDTLEITDSRCVVEAAPSPYCVRIEERLALLKGVVIGRGLSRELNKVFGGPRGCGNLRTLLTGLLPLALNVKASSGIADDETVLETIHQRLQGTCVGYPVADAPD